MKLKCKQTGRTYLIDDGAVSVLQALTNAGYKAYLVGGCVRDLLLGKEPHDWDITTNALPKQVKAVFSHTANKSGLKHGTVTVIVNDKGYEVTTFRADSGYSDFRRPDEVIFLNDINGDLARRDFTINAMALGLDGELVDPYHGATDLTLRHLSCVGNPYDRFREDPLRVMRALRFACTYDLCIEPYTEAAIRGCVPLLEHISEERIMMEFRKLMVGNVDAIDHVLTNYFCVFATIIPELAPMFMFDQRSKWHCYYLWEHTVKAVCGCESDEILRLAAFFHDIGKPHCCQMDNDGYFHFRGHGAVSAEMTDKIMKRLHFENEVRERVVRLVKHHDDTINADLPSVRKKTQKLGGDFERWLDLRRADVMAQSPYNRKPRLEKLDKLRELYKQVLEEKPPFTVTDLAISGGELIKELNMKPGPEVGFLQKLLLDAVLNGYTQNKKESLLEYAQGRKRPEYVTEDRHGNLICMCLDKAPEITNWEIVCRGKLFFGGSREFTEQEMVRYMETATQYRGLNMIAKHLGYSTFVVDTEGHRYPLDQKQGPFEFLCDE